MHGKANAVRSRSRTLVRELVPIRWFVQRRAPMPPAYLVLHEKSPLAAGTKGLQFRSVGRAARI